MIPTLLIRADASARLGAGHVMRCLALAQQWAREGGRVVFAQADVTPALTARLRQEGFATVPVAAAAGSAADARETVRLAETWQAGAIVADGYSFGSSWQERVMVACLPLLVFDDCGHAEHYHADWVLNQNASARSSTYARRDGHTALLLGTRYTLLRREFLEWSEWQRVFPERADRVLVTLGGADDENYTAVVIDALTGSRDAEVTVVIGGLNPHRAGLDETVSRMQSAGQCIRLAVDVTDMPALMAWADVAVTAGGSTVWEAAYFGLPSLVMVNAPNQTESIAALAQADAIVPLGPASALKAFTLATALDALRSDQVRRETIGRNARQLIDGGGAGRVVGQLKGSLRD